MAVALSVPTIIVNNETIRIVPNSFVYDGGEGEITVRSASGGGNEVSTVHTANAETKIGKCKFELFLTADIDAKVSRWKNLIGSNSVQAIQKTETGSITLAWDNCSLMNAVERTASADGTVSLEFEGDPMSIQ